MRPTRIMVGSIGLTLLVAWACDAPERSAAPQARPVGPPPPAVEDTAADPRPLVVFLGDSLTAGLGVGEEQAFPAVVATLLEREGHPVRAVNAGVSGDTSAGGLARLDWVLGQRPAVLVVGLGANDGLRGLPVDMTEDNLRAIVVRARQQGCSVLLLAMHVPTSYGREHAQAFHAIYERIATDLEVSLVPEFLAGVGGVPALNQADGIHPTAEGHRRLAANVLPHLARIVAAKATGPGRSEPS